jgi:hypothetical protein
MLQSSELASSYPFRAVVHMQERQAASSDCANGEHDVTLLGRHDEFADVSRWDDETAVDG